MNISFVKHNISFSPLTPSIEFLKLPNFSTNLNVNTGSKC